MEVVLIGSGNIATVLGRLLQQNCYRISQVYSRNRAHAEILAAELKAVPIADLPLLNRNADLYIVAVTDDALPRIAAELSLENALVIHTAGSVSKEILKNASTQYGVLWPMKMIRKTMQTIRPATIVIDGNSEKVIQRVEAIARGFSETITIADDHLRTKMHMLAAVTSNFSNHLYQLAADYCEQENIDFSLFYPIIEETAIRIQSTHPKGVQAGPAMRGDRQTLETHQQLLQKYPQLAQLYTVLSNSIRVSFDPVRTGLAEKNDPKS